MIVGEEMILLVVAIYLLGSCITEAGIIHHLLLREPKKQINFSKGLWGYQDQITQQWHHYEQLMYAAATHHPPMGHVMPLSNPWNDYGVIFHCLDNAYGQMYNPGKTMAPTAPTLSKTATSAATTTQSPLPSTKPVAPPQRKDIPFIGIPEATTARPVEREREAAGGARFPQRGNGTLFSVSTQRGSAESKIPKTAPIERVEEPSDTEYPYDDFYSLESEESEDYPVESGADLDGYYETQGEAPVSAEAARESTRRPGRMHGRRSRPRQTSRRRKLQTRHQVADGARRRKSARKRAESRRRTANLGEETKNSDKRYDTSSASSLGDLRRYRRGNVKLNWKYKQQTEKERYT